MKYDPVMIGVGSCNVAISKLHDDKIWLGFAGISAEHVSIETATRLRDALTEVLARFGPNAGYVQK